MAGHIDVDLEAAALGELSRGIEQAHERLQVFDEAGVRSRGV
jgi:hypothetical protein